MRAVTLGDRVKVQNRALVYHGVTVEDGVFIGPGAILTNDRRPRSLNADGGLARAADWTVSPIRIAVGASIGAGAVVVAGRDVGPYAMVGAGAVVTHDVPGHALVVGNPARQIGWVCICGDRLIETAGDGRGLVRVSRMRPPVRPRLTPMARSSSARRRPTRRPSRQGRTHDPDRPAGHRRRGDRGRHRGPAERDARRRASRRRARGAVRRVHRRQARDRGQQRHGRADVHLRGPRPGPGRRGHHRRPHVQRDGQLDPVDRRHAGLRRHRARHVPDRRRRGSRRRSRRERGPSARSTCSACRPTWRRSPPSPSATA